MWKKFSFFTAELLQSADPGSPLYSIQALDVTSITSGKGKLVFGDSEGGITLCDEEFALQRFNAYEQSVNFAYQFKSSNTLLTIGNGIDYRSDETVRVSHNLATRFRSNLNSNETYKWMLEDLHIPPTFTNALTTKEATLKLWLLDKIDENGQPLCLRSIPLFEKMEEETITCLSVDELNNLIVFGCSSGHIYTLQGNLLRAKKIVPSLLSNQPSSPIRALHMIPANANATQISIFVVSEKQLVCYDVNLENKKQTEFTVLDNCGCQPNCSCLDAAHNLVVACDEGLLIYNTKQRISTCSLPKTKTLLANYHDCLLVGTVDEKQESVLTLYNIRNTCEVFTMDVMRNGNSEDVLFVFSEWGYCFIMTEGHIVYLLREKDPQTKLQILYDREIYSLALSLSQDWNLSEKEVSSIHLAYGDYLYENKEYDKAIKQYCATVEHVDASFIIRRFLDTSLIHQLVQYLEELHRHNIATSDHTLLLMNCYIKLHDNDKLQAFVYEKSLGTHFNVTTAIEALGSSGYSKEALYLAKENGLFEQYLAIQIEKSGAFAEAVTYIATLSLRDAEKALITYGKMLIDSGVEGVTDLMIELSTNYHGENVSSNPENFIHCFVDNPAELKRFLQVVTSNRSHCDPTVWNTLLELLLREPVDSESYSANIMALLTNPAACYDNDEALILLQNSHCDEGLVFIYKKLHLNTILLKLYIDLKRYDEALQLCKDQGKADPSIWVALLTYLMKGEVPEEVLKRMVNAVELSGVVSLFEIIQILAENPTVPSQFVKELVEKQLRREKSIRDSDILKGEQIQKDVEETKKRLSTYQQHAFCFKQTRCIGCGLPLELPAVHFLCGHSYHKACVDLELGHCPKCEVTKTVRTKVNEEVVLKELKESRDGFAYVADSFGKDMFKEEEEEEEEPVEIKEEPVQNEEFNEDEIPMQTLEL